MNLNNCKERIKDYYNKSNIQPLIVNLQNYPDEEELITYFANNDSIEIIKVSDFCKEDELPRLENLIEKLLAIKKKTLLVGLSIFIRFLGNKESLDWIKKVFNLNISKHLVILIFQFEDILKKLSTPRNRDRIYYVEGEEAELPTTLYFTENDDVVPIEGVKIEGINRVFDSFLKENHSTQYVVTNKKKEDFPLSMYAIYDFDAYQALKETDCAITSLDEKWGTKEQWKWLRLKEQEGKSIERICEEIIGNHPEKAILNYFSLSEEEQWLLFITLKLIGSKYDDYLNEVGKKIENYKDLVSALFFHIFDYKYTDESFLALYKSRKNLLKSFSSYHIVSINTKYCNYIESKNNKEFLYYLTDNTVQEKKLIVKLICKYYKNADKREIEEILGIIYPDLCSYLKDYNFNNTLLEQYFSLYKKSKITNSISLELEKMMEEQATKREFNLLISRATILDKLDLCNSIVFFVDALGVEYLPFIHAKCKELRLIADSKVSLATLPSITSKNNEFVSTFENQGISVFNCKELDELKHHGTNEFDYQNTKLPIYIVSELEIINNFLNRIKQELEMGKCEKVFIISDHGSSRMAVIHESEVLWDMEEKGKHSGRCCPVGDSLNKCNCEYATEENGFFVLANWDRFKGGRKANIEVHGGATLEEVLVPVIEISKERGNVEIELLDNTIFSSFRKKGEIKFSSNVPLKDAFVEIAGQRYKAKADSNNNMIYSAELSKQLKAGKYVANIYSSNNPVASNLTFFLKKEGSNEKDLL